MGPRVGLQWDTSWGDLRGNPWGYHFRGTFREASRSASRETHAVVTYVFHGSSPWGVDGDQWRAMECPTTCSMEKLVCHGVYRLHHGTPHEVPHETNSNSVIAHAMS